MSRLEQLQLLNHRCEACPRLRKYCQSVAEIKRRAYLNDEYWGKPISGFGDPGARLIIVGLAPAAHGANRTGRIFTGDRSGDWLFRALHKAGFANQPTSEHREDGLVLEDAYVTCVVKCAPPDNKPRPLEITKCGKSFLRNELELMPQVKVWIALGQIALNGLWPYVKHLAPEQKKPRFGHGTEIPLGPSHLLITSYHPSQQNTFTGRLTEPMFDSIFRKARTFLS